jgi:hypothetical protein
MGMHYVAAAGGRRQAAGGRHWQLLQIAYAHRNIHGTESNRREGGHTLTARDFWLLTQVNFVQMSTHSCLSPWRKGIKED